jgi:hypothetical protein
VAVVQRATGAGLVGRWQRVSARLLPVASRSIIGPL